MLRREHTFYEKYGNAFQFPSQREQCSESPSSEIGVVLLISVQSKPDSRIKITNKSR